MIIMRGNNNNILMMMRIMNKNMNFKINKKISMKTKNNRIMIMIKKYNVIFLIYIKKTK